MYIVNTYHKTLVRRDAYRAVSTQQTRDTRWFFAFCGIYLPKSFVEELHSRVQNVRVLQCVRGSSTRDSPEEKNKNFLVTNCDRRRPDVRFKKRYVYLVKYRSIESIDQRTRAFAFCRIVYAYGGNTYSTFRVYVYVYYIKYRSMLLKIAGAKI